MTLQVKKRHLYFPITFSFFGLILVIDQLLLPMFHFADLPFKVSYFLCALWFIGYMTNSSFDYFQNSEFKRFFSAFIVIMIAGTLGEIYISGFWNTGGSEPFIRSMLIYVLTIFAFGLGLQNRNFNASWLIAVFYAAVFLNLLFIIFKFQLPSWLIDFYYSERYVEAFEGIGLTDQRSILELARPRGLFPNPNGSAFLVNIISLFIFLCYRNRVIKTPNLWSMLVIILAPIILSTLLASRGEFIVSIVLALLHIFKSYEKNTSNFFKLSASVIFIPIASIIFILQNVNLEDLQTNIDRIFSILEVLENNNSRDSDVQALSGFARPFLQVIPAYERFILSPLVGSGFAMVPGHEYFKEGTDFFHNDWFRLLVSSGVIGFLAMIYVVFRFVMPVGWPAFIPFFLPGLVNSFLLNIPAVMFFFFMIGFLRVKIKDNE